MIPHASTPIKHEILTEIFAKGRLSLSEMRIVLYIIRWSWGFHSKEGRRQDWTKSLTVYKISKDIEMDYTWCCRIIENMINCKKIYKNENQQYQFNEHSELWKKVEENSRLRKTQGGGKLNIMLRNPQHLVEENSTLPPSEKSPKINTNKGLETVTSFALKDTCKDTCKDTVLNEKNNIVLKPKTSSSMANLLLDLFCKAFERKMGIAYMPNFAKDKKILKDIEKVYGFDKTTKLMYLFFLSEDKFILKAGFSVGVFRSQIHKLITQQVKAQEVEEWLTIYLNKKDKGREQ